MLTEACVSIGREEETVPTGAGVGTGVVVAVVRAVTIEVVTLINIYQITGGKVESV